jgi:hypothetical protein
MAITPSVLIAAKGFMGGQGLGVSSNMTSYFNNFNSSPVTGSLTNLSSLMPGATTGLPDFMRNSGTQLTAIQAQAGSIIQPGVAGLKKFTSIMNQSAGFGAAAAEWGAALKGFSGKSFSDVGVGLTGFASMASNGMSNVFGGLPALPSMSSLPGAGALTSMAMTAKDNIGALGKSLGGFGTMFDAKDISNLGSPSSLIKNLQNQGLADSVGINDMIAQAGFDPRNIDNIPPAQLQQILGQVQGNDLQKIIKQTGLQLPPTANLSSLASVLDVKNIVSPDVMAAIPGGNLAGLGNAFSNLGGNFTDFSKAGDMLKKIEVPSLPNLEGLKNPLPDDIASAFSGMLGSGDSPLGLPTMSDMLGSVSGKAHMDSFRDISKSMEKIAESPVGKNMINSTNTLSTATSAARAAYLSSNPTATESEIQAAVAADPDVQTAQADVTTAINTFNAQAAGNADLKAVVSKANGALASTTAQLSKEQSNLSLAGIDPTSALVPAGPGSLLGMASKLHSFGVDKQKLGFSEMFDGMASNDLYGDAIKSSLMEGRNIARQTSLNIPLPTKADPDKTLSAELPNIDPNSVEWDSTNLTDTQSALSKLTNMNNDIISWLDANPGATPEQNAAINRQLDVIFAKTMQVKKDSANLS